MREADESSAGEPAEADDRVPPLSLADASSLAAELLAARLLPRAAGGGRVLLLADRPRSGPSPLEAVAAHLDWAPRADSLPFAEASFELVVDTSPQPPSPGELGELDRVLDPAGVLICAAGADGGDRARAALAGWSAAREAQLRRLALRPCAGYLVVDESEDGDREALEAAITGPLEGTTAALGGLAVIGPREAIEPPRTLAAIDASPAIASLLGSELGWEARARAAEAELLALRRDASLARQALNETRRRLERRTLRGIGHRIKQRLRRAGGTARAR